MHGRPLARIRVWRAFSAATSRGYSSFRDRNRGGFSSGGFKLGGGAFQRHPRKLVVGDDLVFNRLYYCPDISYLAPSKYLALLGSVDYLEASCNRRHPLAP